MQSSTQLPPPGEGGPPGPGEGFGPIRCSAPPHPVAPRPPSPMGEGEPAQIPPPPFGPEFYERSGRRKALPKLIYCALRRPVAAVLGFQSSALRLDEPLKRPRVILPVTPRCQYGSYRLAGTPLLKANLTVAAPCFQGTGGAVESLLSRMTVTRPRTPAPSPDSPVCTPGLSMTERGEISMGEQGLDKFGVIPDRTGLINEVRSSSSSPFAAVNLASKVKPRMLAKCRLC